MDPITMIATALTSLKTATDIADFLKSTSQQIDESEYKLKIADMKIALADAMSTIADFKGLIIEKDEEITELKEALKDKTEMTFDETNGIYITKNDSGEITGRYCPTCFDSADKKIRLQSSSRGWNCNLCRGFYERGGRGSHRAPARTQY